MTRHSLSLLVASELLAGVVGFGVMIGLADRLGPTGFADFEYASAVAAWWLVVVRGGFDTIVYREAARRPSLIRPLTDLLLGLRLASTILALMFILAVACLNGSNRGWVVIVAGLVLIPSALASDVGLRASGRFGGLALAQTCRTLGLVLSAGLLIGRPGSPLVAASCVILAEITSTFAIFMLYWREHGPIRPRFRRRAWLVLARRGAVAGATRFARVSLYAGDMLVLGSLATAEILGSYAAARRLIFALLAIGLVIPSALAPGLARAWSNGADQTRSSIEHTFRYLSMVVLPATVGLVLTADRWMSWLFGERFSEGGTWLALIAARLPFVLASNIQQAALIACRREVWALRILLGMAALGLVLVPSAAAVSGIHGVAWGVLIVELIGSIAGWFALRRLEIAPSLSHGSLPAVLGSLTLGVICWLGRGLPLAGLVIAGIAGYGIVLFMAVHFGPAASIEKWRKPAPVFSGGASS